ncbi:hypothetical protein EYF80_001554 [Liparis tanakae]|uniref:Uncharacterized protein n=1 Tax=Liparis tanakae TaxID=230148 RepID=A0A4Z2JFE9_9TELE|nr:hypothetical protein EYF80_001554 [Liparis tanakae]
METDCLPPPPLPARRLHIPPAMFDPRMVLNFDHKVAEEVSLPCGSRGISGRSEMRAQWGNGTRFHGMETAV